MARRKLFCEYGPVCYRLSLWKEGARRALGDALTGFHAARTKRAEDMPALVKGHCSPVLRRLTGVDMALQENKRTNLRLAAARIDGVTVGPGEQFSFWALVGRPTAKKGYLPGLTISNGTLGTSVGGGLCQLANMIHYLVLNSPLEVVELHHHGDALFPDDRRRVPFGTGTSIFYPHVDYRFRNTTDQSVQVRVWVEGDELRGELRAERPFPLRYRLVEEGHRFVREGEDYYRRSRVYRVAVDRETGEEAGRELVLDNRSRVLYDHALIPAEEIAAE